MRPSPPSVSRLSPTKELHRAILIPSGLASWQPSSRAPGTRSPQPAGKWKEFLLPGHLQRTLAGQTPPLAGWGEKALAAALGGDSKLASFVGNPVPPPTLPGFQAGLPAWPQPTPVHMQDPLLPGPLRDHLAPSPPGPSPGRASVACLSTHAFRVRAPAGERQPHTAGAPMPGGRGSQVPCRTPTSSAAAA